MVPDVAPPRTFPDAAVTWVGPAGHVGVLRGSVEVTEFAVLLTNEKAHLILPWQRGLPLDLSPPPEAPLPKAHEPWSGGLYGGN